MYLDSEDKSLLIRLKNEHNGKFYLQNLIENVLKNLDVIDERTFEVYNKSGNVNEYTVAISEVEDDKKNIFEFHQIESKIAKAVKLIDTLEKEGFLHISKFGLLHGHLLLSAGKEKSKNDGFISSSDPLFVNKVVYLLNSTIEYSEKLNKFIDNKFLTEEQINYRESTRLARQNATNSSKIVWANIIGLILSLAAIGFSYYTFSAAKEANKQTLGSLESISEYTKNVENNLNAVSNKLEQLPNKLDSFSSTVDNLKTTINSQQEDFITKTSKLGRSVDLMTESILEYRKNTDDYSRQLGHIVELTDTQLEIWAKQQGILKDEFSRRTNIEMENLTFKFDTLKNMCKVERLEIHNKGNIEAEIGSILYYIDTSQYITVIETLGDDISELETINGKVKYMNNGIEFTIQPNTHIFTKPPIYFDSSKLDNKDIMMQVFYKSKYDSGKKEFKVKLENCLK